MNLVVVESPAKAKTIKKYLGPEFEVVASYGHVRDLVPKEGAVDPDHGFEMKYQIIDRNEKHVQVISKLLKRSAALYLATDPDREGEAISWHLFELLAKRNQIGDRPVYRVVFNEITKHAVQDAVAHPRDLSQDLVNAQQARRALDYLVGFNLSPLLWKKVRRGLSAGRVQSPALRLIVERELEIEAFERREYWTVEADARSRAIGGAENESEVKPFSARLIELDGNRVEQFSIVDEDRARAVEQRLTAAAGGKLRVERVERKQRKRNPAPPFITSTLQQEAARKLGFTAQRTMRTAQQLYEGIDIGGGAVGLITYMRTDSVNLAQEALAELRDFITERYGSDHLPPAARVFKTKSKNAQEAHEAVRPTSVRNLPKQIESSLSKDQFRLYELIWKRTIACQMAHALLNQVAVDLSAGVGNLFRATGSSVAEAGFMTVYLEGRDDAKSADDDEERMLPNLNEGDQVDLTAIRTEQHFTEPPPRYTEASLVKALEEFGIGRPSTYASIISTLQEREYVLLDKKRFTPTDVARVVNKFLTAHFTSYVDYDFTARLEDELDAVSRGEEDWIPLLEQFWRPFKDRIEHTQEHVQRSDVTQETIDELCPKCRGQLSRRLGRNGLFIGCTNYPDCDYTRDLNADKVEAVAAEIIEGRTCPDCGAELSIKRGRYGKFIGCTAYPKCKHIEPLEKPEDTGVTCPQCAEGTLQKKKSRRGKIFYSCSTYPKCDYAVWNEPIAEPCPKCKWPVLTLKTTKAKGMLKVCPQKDCGHSAPVEEVPSVASAT